MAKRLSEIQKKEIIKFFIEGQNIDQLSEKFNFTKLTISRNLKKNLGNERFDKLNSLNKLNNKVNQLEENSKISLKTRNYPEEINNIIKQKETKNYQEQISNSDDFVELTPLNYEIDDFSQKDLSSVPLSEVQFPNIVYMIVDKKIELEIKYLKEFPDWQFLSKEDLNRKTIEIYFDLKNARRGCNKDQKVIKVPNTNVFKIVAPILLSRGISRIVSDDKLIAL